MNAPQEQFIATRKSPTQTDRLIQVLHEAGGEWVSMVYLGEQIGAWAVHSRVADARKMGLNIQNRVEVRKQTDGSVKRFSFYRMLPPT